jgi:predicted amidohydrolase
VLRLTLFAIFKLWCFVSSVVLKFPPERKAPNRYAGLEMNMMKIKIAQLIVGKDIDINQEKILKEISMAESDEWIIFPEAILSGYYPDEDVYTAGLDWALIQIKLDELERVVREKRCHCLLGSASFIENAWRNSVYTFSYLKDRVRHDKIQLSKLDKKHFKSGNALKSYELQGIRYGTLACRELIFPQQWLDLKRAGSQVIFHLNNAIQPHDVQWRHILITRAIENSVFVVSVNNADSPQLLASYVINPRGEIIAETMTEKEESIKVQIDLIQVIKDLEKREDY